MFAIFFLIVWGILFLLHTFVYAVLARVYAQALPHWPLWIGLISTLFICASVSVRYYTHPITASFYYVTASILGTVFIVASFLLVYEIGRTLIGTDSKYVLSLMLVVAGVSSIYALVQGGRVVVKEITVPIAGLSRPVRVAHLSDIHVGTVHQIDYLETIVEKTNAEKPDLVLITGDLFDGSAPIHEEILTPLNNLGAPTYFSTGNHEVYEGLAQVSETVKNLRMKLLSNAVATEGEIQIIGIDDKQALPKGVTLETILKQQVFNANEPTILLYHTPVEWEMARAAGIDLMLSGHTHRGQVFPFTLLVRLSFKYIYGLYEESGAYLHVSSGTGTWGPPMRLGSQNQITILELVPKE